MTISLPLPVEIVSQSAQLDVAVQAMAGSRAIALDTESNSFHHYPEQLCLIQIATCHKVHIIDTISLKELVPLKEVLVDDSIKKVVHGADYDIRSLDRHYGFRIRNLYDTNIAARFAGITQFGLAALIKDLLGVTIHKSKRLQRTDWGRRPLSLTPSTTPSPTSATASPCERLWINDSKPWGGRHGLPKSALGSKRCDIPHQI